MNPPAQPPEENPYEAPREPASEKAAELFFSFPEDSPETLRKTYGAQEASVRVIGLYDYLGAAFSMLGVLLALVSPRYLQKILDRAGPGGAMAPEALKLVMVTAGFFSAGFHLFLGFFLRRLQNWARWVAVVVVALALVGMFPVVFLQQRGTAVDRIMLIFSALIQLYIICILLSSDTGVIMTGRYRSAAVQTPQLDPTPRVRDRVFLGSAALFWIGSLVNAIAG